MERYHLNWKGEPGICKARKNCPFGDLETEHFASRDEARAAFENQHASLDQGVSKKAAVEPPKPKSTFAPGASQQIEENLEVFRDKYVTVTTGALAGNVFKATSASKAGFNGWQLHGYTAAGNPIAASMYDVEIRPDQSEPKAPSEILRELDFTTATDRELEDRKTEIFSKPYKEMTDRDHLEVAVIASEQESRRFKKSAANKQSGGWESFTPVAVEDSKIIAKPKVDDPMGGYMGGRKWVGGKMTDAYMPQKEAAKNIRADIKEAIKKGELPKDLSYSVRMNSGAWVTSISIILGEKNEAGKPSEVHELNENNETLLGVKKYLEALGNQYSSEDVNSQYDYFNSSNHARVRFRSKWD